MSHQVVKNTFYLTLALIGQKIIAFFYYILLARIMMPEKTGAYFLALSIMMMVSVLADFGTTSVIIREVAKDPLQAKTFIQKSLGFKIPFVLLGFLTTLIIAWVLPYDGLTRSLIALSSFILVADSFSLFFYGVLRAHQLLRYESLGMFFGQLLSAMAGIIILFFSPSLFFLILALLLGSSFNLIFSLFQVIRKIGKQSLIPSFDFLFFKKLFYSAFPFALAAIFVKIYSYTDSILLSFFFDKTAVGIYSVAYKFTYAFQFLPLAFVATLYPEMSRLFEKDIKKLISLFDRSIWYMMILASPLTFGIWAIASDAVLLTGESYLLATHS
jgi:O-antigen/teichoic acid export membrane protein